MNHGLHRPRPGFFFTGRCDIVRRQTKQDPRRKSLGGWGGGEIGCQCQYTNYKDKNDRKKVVNP